MLTTSYEILLDAQKNSYAVGAFNVYNMETAQAVISAATEEKSPVILATSEKAIQYASLEILSALLLEMAERAPIPVVVHLDHGKNPEIVKKCLSAGYTSVMFDASTLPESERTSTTKQLSAIAHKEDASIEGERDSIGGREDFINGKSGDYTNPDLAAEFVGLTDIDSFAVSIGNIHGKPLPDEKLDIELLKKIRQKIDIPLVLHGASSTPPNLIKQVIKEGICKINIDTDLRQSFTSTIRQYLNENQDVKDPRDYLIKARGDMHSVVKSKIELFGSSGRG